MGHNLNAIIKSRAVRYFITELPSRQISAKRSRSHTTPERERDYAGNCYERTKAEQEITVEYETPVGAPIFSDGGEALAGKVESQVLASAEELVSIGTSREQSGSV